MGTNRSLRLLFLVLWMIVCTETNIYAQQIEAGEYEIKAAFLFNFLKFVEWPDDNLSRNSEYSICVLGEDPFGPALRSIQNKKMGEKRVTIKLCRELREVKDCHILFISSSEKGNLGKILASVGNSKILTVGDMSNFARAGGIIQFTIKENKVLFIVNVDAANRAKLKISSKLLKLSQIFREQNR
jgi:hypothetical protein